MRLDVDSSESIRLPLRCSLRDLDLRASAPALRRRA